MMEIKTHKESRIINHLYVQKLKIELLTRKHKTPFPCITCTQTRTVTEHVFASFFKNFKVKHPFIKQIWNAYDPKEKNYMIGLIYHILKLTSYVANNMILKWSTNGCSYASYMIRHRWYLVYQSHIIRLTYYTHMIIIWILYQKKSILGSFVAKQPVTLNSVLIRTEKENF